MNHSPTYLGRFIEMLNSRPGDPLCTFLPNGTGEGITWTYTDLHRRASEVASKLRQAVRPGERAILITPPGLEYLAGFFGCLYAGVIAVPAYPPSALHDREGMNRLSAIALDARTTTALVTRELFKGVHRFDFADAEVNWIIIDDDQWPCANEYVMEIGEAYSDPGPDDIAFLQYTSGSTGNPKGVVVTQGSLAANISMIERAYDLPDRAQRAVSWLPLYHDMGLIGLILAMASLGIPITLMPPAAFLRRPVRWLQAIAGGGPTISAAPNFAFEACVRKIPDEDLVGLDLSDWKVAINGAEPVRASTIDRFVNRFSDVGFCREYFYPSFGLAEATLLVSTAPLGNGASIIRADAGALQNNVVQPPTEGSSGIRLVTCGHPTEPGQVQIVDPTSHAPLEEGQVGEIVVSGPHVTRGYWGKAEAGEPTFTGDSVATGDLGAFLDGELVVTGRIKDVLVLRGRNYYPQDVELSAETAHPAVRRGNTVAFTVDDEAGEALVIVLEVVRDKLGDAAEVVEHVRRSITAAHGISVGTVMLVEPGCLPKTSSGKIRRREARRRHLSGELRPVLTWPRN